MAKNYLDIIKAVKKNDFAPIYTLFGEEDFFIDQIEEAIRLNVLRPEERDFNQTIFYGKDSEASQIIDASQRFPMMAERQLVILREAQELSGFSKLESYAKQPNPQTVLVICYKHKKPDGRQNVTKLLKKNGVFFESNRIYENQMPKWIQNYLGERNIQIGPKEAMIITQYLGTQLSKVANECDKLILNLEAGEQVTVEHIQKYIGISKNYNIFELQDALVARDIVKTMMIADYFTANPLSHPMPLIVGSLFAYFSKLYTLHGMKGKAPNDQKKAIGVYSDFIFKNYLRAIKAYDRKALERIFNILYYFDRKSKGIQSGNQKPEAYLREMIFKIFYAVDERIAAVG